jgi:hypothetical protein
MRTRTIIAILIAFVLTIGLTALLSAEGSGHRGGIDMGVRPARNLSAATEAAAQTDATGRN